MHPTTRRTALRKSEVESFAAVAGASQVVPGVRLIVRLPQQHTHQWDADSTHATRQTTGITLCARESSTGSYRVTSDWFVLRRLIRVEFKSRCCIDGQGKARAPIATFLAQRTEMQSHTKWEALRSQRLFLSSSRTTRPGDDLDAVIDVEGEGPPESGAAPSVFLCDTAAPPRCVIPIGVRGLERRRSAAGNLDGAEATGAAGSLDGANNNGGAAACVRAEMQVDVQKSSAALAVKTRTKDGRHDANQAGAVRLLSLQQANVTLPSPVEAPPRRSAGRNPAQFQLARGGVNDAAAGGDEDCTIGAPSAMATEHRRTSLLDADQADADGRRGFRPAAELSWRTTATRSLPKKPSGFRLHGITLEERAAAENSTAARRTMMDAVSAAAEARRAAAHAWSAQAAAHAAALSAQQERAGLAQDVADQKRIDRHNKKRVLQAVERIFDADHKRHQRVNETMLACVGSAAERLGRGAAASGRDAGAVPTPAYAEASSSSDLDALAYPDLWKRGI